MGITANDWISLEGVCLASPDKVQTVCLAVSGLSSAFSRIARGSVRWPSQCCIEGKSGWMYRRRWTHMWSSHDRPRRYRFAFEAESRPDAILSQRERTIRQWFRRFSPLRSLAAVRPHGRFLRTVLAWGAPHNNTHAALPYCGHELATALCCLPGLPEDVARSPFVRFVARRSYFSHVGGSATDAFAQQALVSAVTTLNRRRLRVEHKPRAPPHLRRLPSLPTSCFALVPCSNTGMCVCAT